MDNNGSFLITSRGQYALTAIVELTANNDNKPIPLSEIAETKNISLSYLEQLFAGLRKHGIVKSYRGPGGGYILAKEPNQIFISDILMAAEDSAPAKRKKSGSSKAFSKGCPTTALWTNVNETLKSLMGHISLDQVVDGSSDIKKALINTLEEKG